jgi:protein-tyrosine phosphatase
MKSILFVCLGNICRSPVVEAIARLEFKRAGIDVRVDSAGTADYHIGEQADSRSLASAQSAGYDASPHRARQLSAEDFDEFDAVLAMDNRNLREILSRCPERHRGKVDLFLRRAGIASPLEVPDPYYGNETDFRRVIELGRMGMEKLIGELRIQSQ